MSSIIEGYNYDIFISYRQRDNRGEKWVSEFVSALRTEIESTFKEDISIYYDENPHDGLLETDDVDASLREKLRCLIFIPIISRIYCDDKSFAWVHEFKPFIEFAARDRFGMKITLPNGNIATRVLPIKIHELDREDLDRCEILLGGFLRGVDFIYKSPGVNRPLRSNEDHPHDNQNKTYYRDQINKVANAIKEIVQGVRTEQIPVDEIHKQHEFDPVHLKKKDRPNWYASYLNLKMGLFLIGSILIIATALLIFNSVHMEGGEKTLAIFPLENISGDISLHNDETYFNAGLTSKLYYVRDLVLIPYITDGINTYNEKEQYAPSNFKADYILKGKIQREANEILISLQLIQWNTNRIVWSAPIPWNREHFSEICRETALSIIENMTVKITDSEKKLLSSESPLNPENNIRLMSANKIVRDAWSYFNYAEKLFDTASYTSAIKSYNKIISENPDNAEVYAKRSIARSWGYYVRQFDTSCIGLCKKDYEMAISLDRNLPEGEIAKGFYFYYCRDSLEEAFNCFDHAANMSPADYQPVFYKALVMRRMGKWNESQSFMRKAIKIGIREPLFLTNIGISFAFLHNYDSAILFHQKAIDLVPGWSAPYKNKFDAFILNGGSLKKAEEMLNEATKRTGETMVEYFVLLNMFSGNYAEAIRLAILSDETDYTSRDYKYILLGRLSSALNKSADSRKYYDTAAIRFRKVLEKYPNDPNFHGMLGIAYAGLGRKAEAVKEANLALSFAASSNMMNECEMRLYLAQIYVMNRDFFNALPVIAKLLNSPSMFSEKMLYLDPVWKPFMDEPDYRKKIMKYL